MLRVFKIIFSALLRSPPAEPLADLFLPYVCTYIAMALIGAIMHCFLRLLLDIRESHPASTFFAIKVSRLALHPGKFHIWLMMLRTRRAEPFSVRPVCKDLQPRQHVQKTALANLP